MKRTKKTFENFGICPKSFDWKGSKRAPVKWKPQKPYIVKENLTGHYQAALAKKLAVELDEMFLLGHCHKILSPVERLIFDIKIEVNAIFEEKRRVKRVLAALRREL